MNQRVRDAVENTINDFVRDDVMFSAHDVTLTVRAAVGRGENVSHNEVRDLVHSLMRPQVDAGVFQKNQVTIGTETPFVFYPTGSDPATYDSDWVRRGTPSNRFTRAAVAPTAPAPQLPPGTDPALYRQTDGRGRICVPADLVRQIGLKFGARAFVQVDNQKLKLTATQPATFDVSYLVDKDDNVRISHHLVEQANLTNKANHQFTVAGDVIEVS